MAVEISTWADLIAVNSGLDGDYILMNNLGSGDAGYPAVWIPLGNNTTKFTGIFDGGNYSVSDIANISTSLDYNGFFGYLNGGSVVSNLSVLNVDFRGDDWCGGLTGYLNVGTISNCHTSGYIQNKMYGGGLIGYQTNLSSIVNGCSSSVDIDGLEYRYGGIVGYATGGSFTDCFATGYIKTPYSSSSAYMGGFAGYLSNVYVTNCYTTSLIYSGTYPLDYVGGFAGYITGGGIKNCYCDNPDIIAEGSNVGGFAGHIQSAVVSECHCSTNVNMANTGAELYFGGFAGRMASAYILDCYSSGIVSALGNDTGGFIGQSSAGVVANCNSSAATCASTGDNVGGFIGNCLTTKVVNCYSLAMPSGGLAVGGFIGLNTGTITNCFWDTDTSGTPTSAAGTGKTTAEMKQKATFANWGIADIDDANLVNLPKYVIEEGITYPMLMPATLNLGKIEGTVTNSSTPVQGAVVVVVDSVSNVIENTGITDANGDYSLWARTGVYHVICEYEDAGVKYHDTSKPFVTVT